MSNHHHSVKTDEDVGRRFHQILDKTGDSKSDVLRQAIIDYIESHEGDTLSSMERKLDDLEDAREQVIEEKQELEAEIASIDNRIEQLQSRIDELRSEGTYDDLLEEMVEHHERGANLVKIEETTGKLSTMARLGDHEGVEQVIQEVESHAGGRDDE